MVRAGRKAVLIGLLLAVGLVPAKAIEDLERGKSPQQMFSSDCALCHKSPQGLAKDRTTYGLTRFLRQHYTTESGQAGALAAYLLRQRGETRPARAKKSGSRATEAKKRDAEGADKKGGSRAAEAKKKPSDGADNKNKPDKKVQKEKKVPTDKKDPKGKN